MNARDYADWCEYAGLYLGNVSHADRYRTYERKLSRAGFVTYLVHDFLTQNDGWIDPTRWRSQDVYEMGADAAYRVEQTAQVLETIGAQRLAAKVRTARNTSASALFEQHADDPQALINAMRDLGPAELMAQLRETIARAMPGLAADAGIAAPETKPVPPDPESESWERVEHLLDQYAQAHDDELRGDLAKYGDVRSAPGFDPQTRLEELARLREEDADRERQRDAAKALARSLSELEKKLAQEPAPAPGAVASLRRKFLETYREYAGRPAGELIPELRTWLDNARRFQEQHLGVFRPQPVDDERLLARLAAIGPYEVDIDKRRVRVSWHSPQGLACDWTQFSLSLEFPPKKKKVLRGLLNGYDRLCRGFREHQAALRAEVLASFDIHREWIARMGFDGYELDESGNPTERSIFEHAGTGRIRLEAGEDSEEDAIGIAVYFGVDWDEEHGLELFLDDFPDEVSADGSRVTFDDSGPALSPDDVSSFEKEYAIALPAEYRAFLLAHNGGRPEPSHLRARVQGQLMPVDIARLFSIEPAPQGDENRSLGAAVVKHHVRDLPPHLLPIGIAQTAMEFGTDAKAQLLLALSGKPQGKVLLGFELPDDMIPGAFAAQADETATARMQAAFFEAQCVAIAPSFNALLGRLIPRPSTPVPDWLAAIRAGDVPGFFGWLDRGGKLSDPFTQYGDTFVLSVTDYLAREGPPEFLRALVDRSVIKPKELRDAWLRSGYDLDRFKQLMPLFATDEWRYACASPRIWDDRDLLEQLVAAGTDWNASVDAEGAPPLHYAVRFGRADGVRWLLEHGAAAGKVDKYGRTALIWAEDGRYLEIIKLLLEAGEPFDSLFPHMRAMRDKLRLIRSRWFDKFEPLVEYLKSRGIVGPGDIPG